MTATYLPLATITLTSAQSTVTFSSIPATYRDLVLVFTAICPSSQDVEGVFNSTAADSTAVFMAGMGSGSGSSGVNPAGLIGYGSPAGHQNVIQIMDYSQTNKHKTGLNRYGQAGAFAAANAFRWANTAAINSIRLRMGANFSAGSTFSLYGIN